MTGQQQAVSDEDWDIWSFTLRVGDAGQFMESMLAIDERLTAHPIPDCCESGVLAPQLVEIVIEQPLEQALSQVEALIGHLGVPARIEETRRGA